VGDLLVRELSSVRLTLDGSPSHLEKRDDLNSPRPHLGYGIPTFDPMLLCSIWTLVAFLKGNS
jgi:hypothetical protein